MLTRIFALFLLGIAAVPLVAYDPPVDTAGPVTVTIHEPTVGVYGAGGMFHFTEPERPATVNVSIENSSSETVIGTLRVEVIDRWRVEPDEPVGFEVPGQGTVRRSFRVVAGEGTYNAHYPIHAFAEFTHQGQRLTAHPVLVVPTEFPDPPRARLPVEWAPVEVPSSGEFGLWLLPVYRVRTTITEQETPMPEPPTGSLYQRGAYQSSGLERLDPYEAELSARVGARAVIMSLGPRAPSRRERVERCLIEYPLRLPRTTPIRLRFSSEGTATPSVAVADMDDGDLGPGERVEIQDREASLDAFAGRTVRLQLIASALESGPEEFRFVEPTLTIGSGASAGVEPSQPWSGTLDNGTKLRVEPGDQGILNSTVRFARGDREASFEGFRVKVLGDALWEARSVHQLVSVEDEGDGRYRHHFSGWAGEFDIVTALRAEGSAFHIDVRLENAPAPKPWLPVYIEDFSAGPWSEKVHRVYAGHGSVIQDPGEFELEGGGHSLSTSFVGFDFPGGNSIVQASDVTVEALRVDPERRICTLHAPHDQTLTFIPAADVWEGARTWRDINGLRASGGVEKLAGRFTFDLWRGDYGPSREALERAFRYGLTDALVVWHRWQRWGYDYRLPDIYPPNPAFGTLAEFQQLVDACREAGVLFAAHDNYIDFYPDAEGFTYDNIAFTRRGEPLRAWFMARRQARSYRSRADRILPFVQRNMKLMKEGFGPTATFIDVYASIPPYDYYTHDGRFVDRLDTRERLREVFAWQRDFLGDNAPQTSEAGHDGLIGWLDGADAQHLAVDARGRTWRWKIDNSDTERIPWFDAAHHDLFVQHGAGYPGRYNGEEDERTHGIYSDDYITTEVLTAHPSMVAHPFGRDVVRKYWLLHDLMDALALRRMEDFEFADDSLHRQHVSWSGGAEVWVNRGVGDWEVNGHTLPQYGFFARVPVNGGVVEAAIERLDGVIVEWARSPSQAYVNARPVVFDEISRNDQGAEDPRLARMNPAGKAIDFDGIVSDGGFRVFRDGDAVMVMPLPASPAMTARLELAELPFAVEAPNRVEVLDEEGRVMESIATRTQDGAVVLDVKTGVFAYRLR